MYKKIHELSDLYKKKKHLDDNYYSIKKLFNKKMKWGKRFYNFVCENLDTDLNPIPFEHNVSDSTPHFSITEDGGVIIKWHQYNTVIYENVEYQTKKINPSEFVAFFNDKKTSFEEPFSLLKKTIQDSESVGKDIERIKNEIISDFVTKKNYIDFLNSCNGKIQKEVSDIDIDFANDTTLIIYYDSDVSKNDCCGVDVKEFTNFMEMDDEQFVSYLKDKKINGMKKIMEDIFEEKKNLFNNIDNRTQLLIKRYGDSDKFKPFIEKLYSNKIKSIDESIERCKKVLSHYES